MIAIYPRMSDTHLVKPYKVGKDSRSLAIVIPHKVVKILNLGPDNFIRLKVEGEKDISLKIIKQDEL